MPQALSLSIRTNVAHRVVRVASSMLHTALSLEEQAQELLLQDGKAVPAAQSEASRDIPDAGDADDGDKQGCVQQACAQVARSTKMSRPNDAALLALLDGGPVLPHGFALWTAARWRAATAAGSSLRWQNVRVRLSGASRRWS